MDRGPFAGYSPWGHERLRHDLVANPHIEIAKFFHLFILITELFFSSVMTFSQFN